MWSLVLWASPQPLTNQYSPYRHLTNPPPPPTNNKNANLSVWSIPLIVAQCANTLGCTSFFHDLGAPPDCSVWAIALLFALIGPKLQLAQAVGQQVHKCWELSRRRGFSWLGRGCWAGRGSALPCRHFVTVSILSTDKKSYQTFTLGAFDFHNTKSEVKKISFTVSILSPHNQSRQH